jgi:cytoskeletal protein RodZ
MMNEIAARTLRASLLAFGIATVGGLAAVSAQTTPAPAAAKPSAAAPAVPAASVAQAATTAPAASTAKPTAASANVLSIADIESRMLAQGITITEIEVQDLLVEVEGYGADGRKVELVLDRRSGDTLSQKVKTKK